jgi:predicted nuclease of predicted toxin-antitoxin system
MSASSLALLPVFLIDECLHPSLADLANEMGFAAHHVDRLGLKGMRDRQLLELAIQRDLTLVTNNAFDFRRLYARTSIHSGLVLILPMVRPAQQRMFFRAALNAVIGRTELVNRVIEVGQEGTLSVLREFELPSL